MNKGKYTKREFQTAYSWMFGETMTKGAKVWKESTDEYISAVVDGFKDNARKSFYED